MRTDDEAIARTTNHSDRPTLKCISRRKKRKVLKNFNTMPLNYLNPNDWGRSPLTDRALRLQQIKAENPEQWAAMIEADIEVLSMPIKAETTEFRDTLAHTQLGANAEKLGGWDNAMIIANAIERGDIKAARELVSNYPESRELVERVITVSEKYSQR